MISIPDLINAASQSTVQYLALLTNAGQGVAQYAATSVRPSPRNVALIGNRCWPVILCDLPRHEKFPPDSGAAFVPANNPGTQIGAQVLNYDSRSGRAEIAVSELPADTEGTLEIDFKWLIRRCLEWLGRNGRNVSNPFELSICPAVQAGPASGNVSPSIEQEEAIISLLSHPVAYAWGPPGTGKTRHVLAESVGRLIRDGKRVLVTAPTNLAVDNALDAVLELGCVPYHRILRMGIPSHEFSGKWPECCEESALKGKLNELEAHAERIERRIASKRRGEELERLIPQQQAAAAGLSQIVNELISASRDLSSRIGAAEELLAVAAAGRHRTAKEIDKRRSAFASLKLDELKKGIAALEVDQMTLVLERLSLEKKIAKIGWIARVFTRRHEGLSRNRITAEIRIAEVEGTLRSQRLRLGDREIEAAKLDSEIEKLNTDFAIFSSDLQDTEAALEKIDTENRLVLERLGRTRKEAADVLEKLDRLREEQEEQIALGEFPDDSELDRLEAELMEVRAKSARIVQDLSEKLVLGMTLDGFIGLTMSQALYFDHIFVDEAGYAPLAKILPLLIQRCPISLLGDHRQLPPVYLGRNDVLSESYWGVSALYLEEAFQTGVGDDPAQMVDRSKKDPKFQLMHRSELTTSYRFGPELADLLDRHFYQIGLKSAANAGTSICRIDCPQTGLPNNPAGQSWENAAEADRILKKVVAWVKWRPNPDGPDKGALAILTPYRNQVRLIRNSLQALERSEEVRIWNDVEREDFRRIEVMTVHRSQGREWDTVFFSVSDTGRLAGNDPFLADTSRLAGKLVVNTAISRSKKHLRFFLDCQFWHDRQAPSLLTEIARR